jgi:predicted RNA-binding protein (virulence factor B family)
MTMKAKDLYDAVRQLSPKERLRLAVMILNDITAEEETIEYSDNWTAEDIKDLSAFALSHSENPHETNRDKP